MKPTKKAAAKTKTKVITATKVKSPTKIKKIIAGLVAALVFVAGIITVTSMAGTAQTYICVSSDSTSERSVTGIYKNRYGEVTSARTIYEDSGCELFWNNSAGPYVRVTYWGTGGTSSLRSYKVKAIGGSYGVCHNAPNDSNPPNASKVYYKIFAKTDCKL